MRKGYIHLDGNCLNFSPNNLLIVSLEELRLFHKRKHEKLHPDYVKTVIAQIRLEHKLKELEEVNE